MSQNSRWFVDENEGVWNYPQLQQVNDDGIPVTGPNLFFYQKDMIVPYKFHILGHFQEQNC